MNMIDVAIVPHPFATERLCHKMMAGRSVADIISHLQPDKGLARHAHAYLNGDYVPRERWVHVTPKAGTVLSIRLVPMGGGGGKNPLRTVLSLALLVAVPQIAGGLGGLFGNATFFGLSIGRGISTGFSLLGQLALNALAPPPKPRLGASAKESATLFIQGARNQASPFSRVPKVLGKHRFVPPLGALPYTETIGNDQYIRMLFVWGYGPLAISDLKIGETPLSDFTDVQIETRQGYPGDAPISLYTNSVIQNDLQVSLTFAAGYVTRTTEADAEEISVDITLPRGLVKFGSGGKKTATSVSLEIQYSPKGLNQWSAGLGAYKTVSAQSINGVTVPAAYIYRGVSHVVTRLDRIMLDPASGGVSLIQGTGFRNGIDSGVPQPPAIPAGFLAVAKIERRSGDAAVIPANRITDERDLSLVGNVFEASGNFLASAGVANTISIAAGGLKFGAVDITGKQTSALRRDVSFRVPRGQYDVRVKRLTADSVDDSTFDETLWTSLRTIRYAQPVTMSGLAMTAVRIKATDQLHGVIDRFNGVVHSILPDWNGSAWVDQVTSNPASLFRHVLQGNANARPLADSRLDMNKIQDWHDACATAGREFNAVIDYNVSVRDVLQDIAAVGRASPTLVDGKWAVVEDKLQTVPIQHFTPRNSFQFKGEKSFAERPDALRIRFVNRENGWLQDERLVFDDGFDAATATKYETLELPGVTIPDQAWQDGRYHVATARLRPETYSFFADMEHIVCTRGDLIRFTHDVPLFGLGAARIKSVSIAGGLVTAIVVDDLLVMEAGRSYSVRLRRQDGSTLLKNVVTVVGQNASLTFVTPFDDADAPSPGDLALFGEAGSESVELIVKSIEPIDDMKAKLTCVDAAPAIHASDTGTIPPFNSQITVPPDLKRPPAPVLATLQSDEAVLIQNADGSLTPAVVMTLAPPDFPLPLSLSAQIRGADESVFFPAQAVSGDNKLTLTGIEGGKYYDIKVIHKNATGISSAPLLIANYLVIGDTGLPSDVANFTINVLAGTAYLSWEAVSDSDLSHYRVKFSNATSGATWANSVDLVTRVGRPATTVAVPASSGTFLIKAVDMGGRESTAETLIVSSVAATFGYKDVQTVTEDPAFTGTKTDVEVVSSALRLTSGSSAGTYAFNNAVDLGVVYTSTLSASITAVGSDLTTNVDTIANVDIVEDWDGAAVPEKWGVTLQVRTTNDDPAGSPAWSAWKNFAIGEYSARAFQFKAVLASAQAGITPSISALAVTLRMPSRTQGENNQTSASTDTPTVVTYTAAFHTFNALTITAQSMATGDYYTITNPTASGFEIIFKDSAGTRITRTFDYIATGFGQ